MNDGKLNQSFDANSSNTSSNKSPYLIPFILITSLFFMWGLANNLNGILIPHLRKALLLSNTQSTFVDSATYLAYFVAAIPAGILLNKIGYKNGIIIGLLIFSAGCFLFIPAANTRNFGLFLFGLFIIGIGLATLETAANPYAAQLGPEENSTTRLNLAQSFNGLAAFAAPFLGALFILSGKEYTADQLALMNKAERLAYLNQEASSVKGPYITLAFVLIFLALLFYFIKFPDIKESEEAGDNTGSLKGALKFSRLRWAAIAQFFYVGAQVCITSFFIRLAVTNGGLGELQAAIFLGYYGLLFMAGRFVGTLFTRFIPAPKLLTIYAGIAILLCLGAINLEGTPVVYILCALGLFLSIMFPTIFALGIKGLGSHTKAGSSLIVMAIIGGAIFPVIMGNVIDRTGDNIQTGYYVPMICFAVVLLFAVKNFKQT